MFKEVNLTSGPTLQTPKMTRGQAVTIGGLFLLIFCGSLGALIYGVVHKRADNSIPQMYPTIPTPPTIQTPPPLPTTTEDPSKWQLDQTVARRLPDFALPTNYDIQLSMPSDNSLNFDGIATIDFETTSPTPQRRIQLNAVNLDIKLSQSKLTKLDKKGNAVSEHQVLGMQEAGVSGIAVLHVSESLAPNTTYSLRISYSGRINNETTGVFYKDYIENGAVKRMYGTQSECCGARRIFPCFDEPAFKARFTLEVTAPANFTITSNMPVNSTQGNGTANTARFQTTPKMSSYLLAFAITQFDYLESTAKDGTVIRTWARPEVIQSGQADLVANVSAKILDWYGDYFGTNYSSLMPKLDQIIVPPDLVPMENWGMITYGEQVTLFAPNRDAPSVAEYAILTVSHEMAHMWFGDLVTMSWWDQVWLNEGVADYLDYYANEAVTSMQGSAEPLLLTQAAENVLTNGLGKSIVNQINNTEEQIMGHMQIPVQYDKAAVTVLAKLNSIVGRDNLQTGFRRILSQFAHSNFNQDDLFNAIPTELYSLGDLVYPELENTHLAEVKGLRSGRSANLILRLSNSKDTRAIADFYLNITAFLNFTKAPAEVKQPTEIEELSAFLNFTKSPTGVTFLRFAAAGLIQSYYAATNDGLHGLYTLFYTQSAGQPVGGDYATAVITGELKPACDVAAKTMRDIAFNYNVQSAKISNLLDLATFSMSSCYSTLFYSLQVLDLAFLAQNGNGLALMGDSTKYYEKYANATDSAANAFHFPTAEFDPVEDNMLQAMSRELLVYRAIVVHPPGMAAAVLPHFKAILKGYQTNTTVQVDPLLRKLSLCEGFKNMRSSEFDGVQSLLCHNQEDASFVQAFGCATSSVNNVIELIWAQPISCRIQDRVRLAMTSSLVNQLPANTGALLKYISANYGKSKLSEPAKQQLLQAAIANAYLLTDKATVQDIVKQHGIKLDMTVIQNNENFRNSAAMKQAVAWAEADRYYILVETACESDAWLLRKSR